MWADLPAVLADVTTCITGTLASAITALVAYPFMLIPALMFATAKIIRLAKSVLMVGGRRRG